MGGPKKWPKLSRLGELLNTQKNVHFFAPRGGPPRGAQKCTPGGPPKGGFCSTIRSSFGPKMAPKWAQNGGPGGGPGRPPGRPGPSPARAPPGARGGRGRPPGEPPAGGSRRGPRTGFRRPSDDPIITVPTGDALRSAIAQCIGHCPKHSVTCREGPRHVTHLFGVTRAGGCIPQCLRAL